MFAQAALRVKLGDNVGLAALVGAMGAQVFSDDRCGRVGGEDAVDLVQVKVHVVSRCGCLVRRSQ